LIVSFFVHGEQERALTPKDDYYTAPFCFLQNHRNGELLVFTCRVPWLHGNPFGAPDRAHHRAHAWMREKGTREGPHLGTVEAFAATLDLDERRVHAFTPDGCYPALEDITRGLEDRAVEVTCAAMGWARPEDWRRARAKLSETHGLPLLDLADWDAADDASPPRAKQADEHEEKKDPGGEYRC
jgi:hypothetical protein